MPSVNLSPETYEALKKIAEAKGCTPDEVAQAAVEREIKDRQMSDEEWKREWELALSEVRAGVPKHLTAEDVERDVAATLAKVRAERRAPGR